MAFDFAQISTEGNTLNTVESPILWVNDLPVPGEHLRLLLVLKDNNNLIDKLISQTIIDAECDRQNIEVDREELVKETTIFRKEKQLFTGAEVKSWILENGLNDQLFESLMRASCRRRKLKSILTKDKIDKYFAMERWRFESAEIYRIKVSKRSVAEELSAQILEGTEFFGLAKQYSEDETSAPACGYLGWIRREKMRPEIESEIFKTNEGSITTIIESIDGFHIYWVERKQAPQLTAEIVLEIEDKLFDSWLKERVDSATIAYP